MSKLDYEYMRDYDGLDFVVFDKKKYTKEQALKDAPFELFTFEEERTTPLVVFTTFVEYGFFTTSDGETFNNWNCPDIYERERKHKGQVDVWAVMTEKTAKRWGIENEK